MSPKITVLAGELIHATTTQFRKLSTEAPNNYVWDIVEGPEVFERLAETDLFIAAGLYWTGSDHVTWTKAVPYTTPNEAQREAFLDYITSGRPTLAFHGGMASFDDWPTFGRSLGFAWNWDITTHGPVQEYRLSPEAVEHPCLDGVGEFSLTDENYYNIQIREDLPYQTLLKMDCGPVQLPQLMVTEGSAAIPGKRAYLGLGHDARATDNLQFQRVLWNTVRWLLT